MAARSISPAWDLRRTVSTQQKRAVSRNAAAINSGNVELLDRPRLVNQLASLERRTGRSAEDAVDHPRSGHDDVSNAAAGALVYAVRRSGLRASFLPSAPASTLRRPSMAACCPLRRTPAERSPLSQALRRAKALKAAFNVYQQREHGAADYSERYEAGKSSP
jgi:hypothetical protein